MAIHDETMCNNELTKAWATIRVIGKEASMAVAVTI